MFLSPHEIEKLMLVQVGVLAQRRLARGLRLSHPEAVGLIATVVLELIRDGKHSVPQLMEMGRTLLGMNQVMAGVAEMIPDVQVEGTFPDGTKLVSVHEPIHLENGDLKLALFGSFLPAPSLSAFESREAALEPGRFEFAEGEIAINAGREAITITVTNTGERPIQVGSHFHFIETNRPLRFDRAAAYGKRLDIAAGAAIRFEPGETKQVRLVDIDGNRVIRGGNRLATGPVSEHGKTAAMEMVIAGGYSNTGEK
ncbi:MAG: urease subunit beta [Cryobacterium sp.]|nr:urease subunit beta [Cryobacterium sp.]